jgi:hypothetical protein
VSRIESPTFSSLTAASERGREIAWSMESVSYE